MCSKLRQVISLVIISFCLAGTFARATNVLSYHNDLVSSGVNSTETVLTPAGLTTTAFSKRFTASVDGQIYTQPLYLAGVTVTGGTQPGLHNLVFVATQHDSLYAIDASSGAIVWKTSFLTNGLTGATAITSVPNADVNSNDLTPEIGICGTPVIDASSNFLYVAAKTKQIVNNVTSTPHYVYTLYQIDITNGNATANANIANSTVFGDTTYDGTNYTFRTNTDPTAAQDPFVFGSGDGAITVNGLPRVYFNVLRQMNRTGLVLSNGIVYVAFGSHGDVAPYHGIVLGFDKNSLAVTAVLNLTPNGILGGIWQSGGIPALDSSGNLYIMTGNGAFDGSSSNGVTTGLDGNGFPVNGNYGDCIVKISPDSSTSVANQNINGWGLKVADYFSPFENLNLDQGDVDLGAGACMLLPDSAGSSAHPHLLVGTGKEGQIYLVDRDGMGGFSPTTDNVVQFNATMGPAFDTPAFFNGVLYYAGINDPLKAFTVSNGAMSTTPTQGTTTFGFPGTTPSISANGTSNGIVWTICHSPAQLRAYSVSNFANPIWTSDLAASSRDSLDSASKFSVPTIADGQVFVGTSTALIAFGVTPGAPPTPPVLATSAASSIGSASATFNGTVNPEGGATTVFFQYGTTTSYGSMTSTQNEGSGSTSVGFSATASSLAAQTLYHFRAVANYSGGTVFGADKTLTTSATPVTPPVITTISATAIAATSATLNGTVNPEGHAATVFFQYGATTSYGSSTVTQSGGSGSSTISFTSAAASLTVQTLYHYRAVATYTGGTVFGTDHTFTTLAAPPAPPVIATSVPTGIEASTVTLNGIVNPKGDATTVSFQYGTTTSYGSTTSGQSEGSGSVNVNFLATPSALLSRTLYHYRAVANYSGGTVVGLDKTFTTLPAPVIATTAASFLGGTGAQVGQGVNPNGMATSVYFQFGATTAYGTQTAVQSAGSGLATVNIYASLPDLTPGTLYHYRVVTVSAAGTFFGADQTFTTLPFVTTVVAKTGDAATGISGATLASFISPTINANDHTSFAAGMTLSSSVVAGNNFGIWADNGSGNRQFITRNGLGTAPGTPAPFTGFSVPVYNGNDDVAFLGILKVGAGLASSTTDTGIWSTSSGALTLVAREGSAAPGTAGTFGLFGSLGLSDSNGAIIFAVLNLNATAGITAANDIGIWEGNTAADLSLVLRTGATVGGKTIAKLTFLPLEVYVNGQTRSFAPASGDIVCGATFTDTTTGIVDVVNGTPALVATSGGAATGIANATFASFNSPAINNGDHTAFLAKVLGGGVTAANNTGIWADNSGGTRHLVIQNGASAPGTAAFFATFSDPVYNNNEAVAFVGTVRIAAGQAVAANSTGIWSNSTGSLALVARAGFQAPGCRTGATFGAFYNLVLPDQGGAVLLASLNVNAAAGVTASNNLGIWAVDSTGNLQSVVRTGDVVHGKLITGLSFIAPQNNVNGQGRSVSQDTGDLVYVATFGDTTTAIIKVVFP
jgi:hypothetical protein